MALKPVNTMLFLKPLFALSITIYTSIFFISCHNPNIAPGISACIYTEINRESKDPGWMVGSVKEYQFLGKTVYAFEPDITKIADGTTAIKDVYCNTLCNVGGFAGPANNQCIGGNFFKDAVYKRTIWQKK